MADYKEKTAALKKQKAKKLLQDLPPYCETYYASIAEKAGGTIYSYIRDIHVFFRYLVDKNPDFQAKGMRGITLEDLSLLTRNDIYEFINTLYKENSSADDLNDEKLEIPQKKSSKRQYLSALNSFFGFWEDEDAIPVNIVKKVDRTQYSSSQRHHVIRLDDEEEVGMLSSILHGTGLTSRQQHANKKTSVRDYAICITLLRTGIRVSELVGLNIDDINFKKNYFVVARKKETQKNDKVYFDDDVADALTSYLGDKAAPFAVPAGTPVFTVSQGKYKGQRLGVRSVESIVWKYSQAGAGKKVSPHKLRATYATNMIAETGDINLVKSEMGHMNIQTTTIYIDDEALAKEQARNTLKKRRDKMLKDLLDESNDDSIPNY